MAPETRDTWAEELKRAPRHRFVPDIAWTFRHGLINRTTDPDTWRSVVDTDIPIVTQIDDGTTELTDESPRMTTVHSSSCSAPRFVTDFLNLLDPYPGNRVLEIGTGTGWTAALLSARLGDDHVTTVEVDPEVAKEASAHLRHAGLAPTVIVDDGAKGHAENAPYDRVHVTCGVATVPYAWIEQTRPGGIIALPWMHGALGGGHKVTLTSTGTQATGRIHSECAYMVMRDQRRPIRPIEGEARESELDIDPRRVINADSGLSLWIAASIPDVMCEGSEHPDGSWRFVAFDRLGDSHAYVEYRPHDRHGRAEQRGPRDLWQETQHAYLAWVTAGQPPVNRFGITVTPHEHRLWIDHPEHPIEGNL